jgi:hypothetical protein
MDQGTRDEMLSRLAERAFYEVFLVRHRSMS